MRGGIIIFKETITSCSEALCGSLLFILVFKIKKNYINFRWIHDGWLLEYWAFPNSNSMPSRLYCAAAIFHIKKWITWTESQSLDLQSCEISSRFHKEWPICTMLNSHDWCWVHNGNESEEVISWPASGDLCELIKWSASRSGQQEINKTFRLQL